ncbi:ABC transporter permease [Alteribacillus sp. YIM 98480]|uniref:ABC transporter permease n=1 Tax=Alteribacillus sp. YIM 98480 TaxID=2606599 RepID=UPI00131A92A4|nr:ABC transporter permease [Alteribacillus sp. YIM 98480]
MDVTDLWEERSKRFWNEAIRYLRLLGNSGFMFSLYALFLAGGYFYPSFIEWLPETFPVPFVLTALFTYLLTVCPLRTFLKEGDLVFLLPLEQQLKSYFRKSVIYSIVMQSVPLAILLLLTGPLFQDRVSSNTSYLYIVLFLLLAGNIWNYAVRWAEIRIQDDDKRKAHIGGRALINAIYCYFLFVAAPLWFVLTVLLIMVFLYGFYHIKLLRNHPLKWELLLRLEEKRLSAFYRFVQSFTDVPHIKMAVRRRRWLSAAADRYLWNSGSIYSVLFGKAFIRSGEYFGMYVRLLLTSALVMYAFPSEWVRLGAALLFLYMTSVQLKTLWHHLDTIMWPDLYPVSYHEKESAFKQLMKKLLIFQTILLTVVYWIVSVSVLPGLLILAAGFTFSLTYPVYKGKRSVLQTN